MASTMNKSSGPSKDYKFEKVTFVPSAAQNGEFIPRISIHQPQTAKAKKTDEKSPLSSSVEDTDQDNNDRDDNNNIDGDNNIDPTDQEQEAGQKQKQNTNGNKDPDPKNNNQDENQDRVRQFRAEDMPRILDYDNMPEPPPPDAILGHLEYEMDDDDTISEQVPPRFPKRYFCLRGSYVFYFDADDVTIDGATRGTAATADIAVGGGIGIGSGAGFTSTSQRYRCPFNAPPLGVIPLERCVVEFPPGGRRVFREHAKTTARNGYEMVIRHVVRERLSHATTANNNGNNSNANDNNPICNKRRAPAYLVMDGIGQRDFWAKAIRIRADVYKKDTKLRPSGDIDQGRGDNGINGDPYRHGISPDRTNGGRLRGLRRPPLPSLDDDGKGGPANTASNVGGNIAVLAGVMEAEEQNDVQEALVEFGNKLIFEETGWVNNFYQKHDEYESPAMCRTLERWQSSIKKGLRGAVLEQYEYFVEASREMTIMGREVMSLKELVGKQVDTIEAMKNVYFELDYVDNRHGAGAGINGDYGEDDPYEDSSDEDDEDDEDGIPLALGKSHENSKVFLNKSQDTIDSTDSFSWEFSKKERHSKSSNNSLGYRHSKGTTATTITSGSSGGVDNKKDSTHDAASFQVEVPSWLEDATEEISVFIKECRYADAAELLFKAKTEATEILNMHEKLSEKKLAKKQLATMQRILRSIDNCTDRMCNRLSEGLRRKNEALKQAAKKERADPLSALAPLVSPIALNDDATSLQLLVKLGRAQDAATAYSARRSLLLTECLHERPICDTTTINNADVVIYAAQLSQSFFSCLATSVESFLDLFLGGNAKDDISESSSTIISAPFQQQKIVPASALAAIALWCDSELNKFSATFGSKVLGNLALSPRNGQVFNSITDTITEFEVAADIAHLKNQLRSAEEMGEHLAAGNLRKKIAIQEKESKEGNFGNRPPTPKSVEGKNRKLAISIAGKCVDRALEFSTECLNTIGLPLTPRLAEYMRPRLKGTEAEIAMDLDRWDHIIFDWKDTPVENEEAGRRLSNLSPDIRLSLSHDSP